MISCAIGGSGTTFVVAKKLGRRFLGWELSDAYADRIQARLDATEPGQPLEGAEEPRVASGVVRKARTAKVKGAGRL